MQTFAQKRKRRHERIRAKVSGTSERPRLAVYRSNKHIEAQLIDDATGTTILASSDRHITDAKKAPLLDAARMVGVDIAKKAKAKKVDTIVFDRGGFNYAGAVRALAEGAREGGLIF